MCKFETMLVQCWAPVLRRRRAVRSLEMIWPGQPDPGGSRPPALERIWPRRANPEGLRPLRPKREQRRWGAHPEGYRALPPLSVLLGAWRAPQRQAGHGRPWVKSTGGRLDLERALLP